MSRRALQNSSRSAQDIFILKEGLACNRLNQAQQGASHGGLPTARLTNDPKRLLWEKIETDVVNRFDIADNLSKEPSIDGEILFEVFDL